MSQELTPFSFEDQELRIVMINGDPWFVAVDAAKILGYKNSTDAIGKHVPDKYKMRARETRSPHNLDPQTILISEPGLYRLIARSDMPNAEKFQDWVFEEVLPQIRKTGSYGLLPQDYPSALRALADAEEEKLKIAERARELEINVMELAPKAEEFDSYINSKGLVTLANAAQTLHKSFGMDIGRKRLIDRLRDKEVLCKPAVGEGPRPRQEYLELGWFEVHPVITPRGAPYSQTFVTAVGISGIFNLLKDN